MVTHPQATVSFGPHGVMGQHGLHTADKYVTCHGHGAAPDYCFFACVSIIFDSHLIEDATQTAESMSKHARRMQMALFHRQYFKVALSYPAILVDCPIY